MSRSLALVLLLASLAAAFSDGRNEIEWQGRERSFLLRLPPGLEDGTHRPLVIVLHGGGGSASRMEDMTGLTEAAASRGMIAVYPDGTGALPRRLLTWNSGYIDVWAKQHSVDDVGFVSALVDTLSSCFPVDPGMVFATGISNGGMMAYRLAAELSGIFAAAAPVAGSIGGIPGDGGEPWTISVPEAPVSILIIHGMQDAHVRYAGGSPSRGFGGQRDREDMSVAEAVEFWVSADSCVSGPFREELNGGEVLVESWMRPGSSIEVRLCTVVPGGHSWPGSDRGLPGDPPYEGLDASGYILDFFLSHPRY